jgi:AraC family transcriptional regulator, glycine betaine-responsive activator
MFGYASSDLPQSVTFLLVPDFSMMAFTSALEPLRTANLLAEAPLYSWRTLSVDGRPVRASNGVELTPQGALSHAGNLGTVFVCAGLNVYHHRDQRILDWLRGLARRGQPLGAVCTGTMFLAWAGLLEGYRCTIHWEHVEGFAEAFPSLEITATMFEIDRNRFTCSGGTAPLDMMVYAIERDHGDDLARKVAEQMLHSVQRQPQELQRKAVRQRTDLTDPKLLAAIAHMEAFLENPVSPTDVADAVGLSERQLERLFRARLGKTPSRYYLEMRLQRAQGLLRHSPASVLQVAVSCGFTSASHFAKCYRQQFGHSPRAERALTRSALPKPLEGDTAP